MVLNLNPTYCLKKAPCNQPNDKLAITLPQCYAEPTAKPPVNQPRVRKHFYGIHFNHFVWRDVVNTGCQTRDVSSKEGSCQAVNHDEIGVRTSNGSSFRPIIILVKMHPGDLNSQGSQCHCCHTFLKSVLIGVNLQTFRCFTHCFTILCCL